MRETKAVRLLDYGSGKGYQYLRDRIHDVWGGILPHCYDPGVRQLIKRPEGLFDGVICTDVMEHIDRRDVGLVLTDIFGFLRPGGFAYFNIYCGPSGKKFPDGTDVHLTVETPEWWEKQIGRFRTAGRIIKVDYAYPDSDDSE